MRSIVPLLLLLALALPLRAQGLPPAAVETGTIRKETVRDVVAGVATVEPWLRTVLGAEIAGRVEKYPLREGDRVEAGKTVVCELSRTDIEIDLAEAKALLARAEAEAATAVATAKDTMEENRALKDRAEKDLERAKELFAQRVINKAELDQAEADAIAARFRFQRAEKAFQLAREGTDPAAKAREAEVRRARATLDRAKDRLRKSRIVSPVTGRVVRRMTEVGGWLGAGSPVVEVITLDPVLVRIRVNERDIAGVRIGNPAEVEVTSHPGRTFTGKVRFLVPEADAKSRAFPVLIEVANPDGRLLAGMYATVRISAGEPREALTAPKDAIADGPMGKVVYTLGDGKQPGTKVAVPIPVRAGLPLGGRVTVEGKGLSDGLVVITTGNEAVIPGRPVVPAGPGGRPAEKPSGGE